MADSSRNKLAAQIMKAEMMDDKDKLSRLRAELAILENENLDTRDNPQKQSESRATDRGSHDFKREPSMNLSNNKIQKFVSSTSSLSSMFVNEKSTTVSDEVKMYLKTSAKFARDDTETKYFSGEIDDSQVVLNKSKRHKPDSAVCSKVQSPIKSESCYLCPNRQPQHLIVDNLNHVYLSLSSCKPLISDTGEVVIRNIDHDCNSFISSHDNQSETEQLIEVTRDLWKSQGYHCIMMETFFRDRKPSGREFVSCGNHFQVYCLPIEEKYYEKVRMTFKQSLQAIGGDWSMNKNLIQTIDGRRIQRFLPKGLSYFWVCFDDLKTGFGHVIESERNFSRFFGLEVLSGVLNKSFDPAQLNEQEDFRKQFERCRDFKLLYNKCKS